MLSTHAACPGHSGQRSHRAVKFLFLSREIAIGLSKEQFIVKDCENHFDPDIADACLDEFVQIVCKYLLGTMTRFQTAGSKTL